MIPSRASALPREALGLQAPDPISDGSGAQYENEHEGVREAHPRPDRPSCHVGCMGQQAF
jgi:hypothetical protein